MTVEVAVRLLGLGKGYVGLVVYVCAAHTEC